MDKDKKWLLQIDEVLDEFREAKDDKQIFNLLYKFCEAISRAIQVEDDLRNDDPLFGIFNEKLDQEKKRFTASCLLRLLNVNDKPFREINFKVKVFKLFDDIFTYDIYKFRKIDIKEQTYEKESKLKGIVSELERNLSKLILSFNNINSLSSFQQQFMQNINSNPSKAILWPFIPRQLLESRLKDIFKFVEEYLNEKGTGVLQSYENARNILKEYFADAYNYGTKYSRDYLGTLSKKLIELLDSHFQSSPVSKPAELKVEKVEKKYPFYIPGKEIELFFIVKNVGPGYAFDVEIEAESTISITRKIQFLGQIEPDSSIEVQIPSKTENSEKEGILLEIKVNWRNFDGSFKSDNFEFELKCQRSDIDWVKLEKERPYSLEPVTTEDELVGRSKTLNELEALVTDKNGVGSAFISGQKRVGKTSIAKTLKTRLEKHYPEFLIIYLDRGDYIHSDAVQTIENLGRRIVKEVRSSNKKFANLEIPEFRGALSPLSEFLDDVIKLEPNLKILIILDEFDELPIELYKKGPLGNAFFGTIRSISGKPFFGFILVGSEKMDFVISCQGDKLNKFQSFKIDYFDKETHWSDFTELVQRPVKEWLEIPDEALLVLYDETSGNPYFTKLICIELFKIMVERRDCYVTYREIEDAIKIALRKVSSPAFQHFWEDGIIDTGPKAEEKSVMRRKLLLSLSEVIRQDGKAQKEHIKEKSEKWRLSTDFVEKELDEFKRRQVLIVKDNSYKCKVKFFERWLVEKGFQEIVTDMVAYDELARQKEEEEKARVTSEEITALLKNWGPYKGRIITEDQVRKWLNQFGDNKKQRLMFKILQDVKFYTNANIRAKMKEAHDIVKRGLVWRIKGRKREDIFVSYLDEAGKQGPSMAKIYADENGIYYENVIEKSKITSVLKRKAEELPAFALVFIDDFIGTGDSACEYFKELVSEHGEILKRLSNEPGEMEGTKKLQIFFIAICGFQKAQDKIEKVLNELEFSVKIHICDPLSEEDKVFSEKSKIFTSESERNEAKEIAYEYGSNLVKKAPLGYGDCQVAIVFEHNCPNNSLPILWAKSKDFTPLFQRNS